jgi:hypothetical protein
MVQFESVPKMDSAIRMEFDLQVEGEFIHPLCAC